MKTFNRIPQFVNTPSSSDVKHYYFNHTNWTGVNENKNSLTVDQLSFEDANNVYVDREGLLRGRPSIKELDGDRQASKVWDFGFCQVYQDDNPKLHFVENGVERKEWLSDDSNPILFLFDGKIIIIHHNEWHYYFNGNVDKVSGNLTYKNLNKFYFNGDESDREDLTQPENLLYTGHYDRYQFDSIDEYETDKNDIISKESEENVDMPYVQYDVSVDGVKLGSYDTLADFDANNVVYSVSTIFANCIDDGEHLGTANNGKPIMRKQGNSVLLCEPLDYDSENPTPLRKYRLWYNSDVTLYEQFSNIGVVSDCIMVPFLSSDNSPSIVYCAADGSKFKFYRYDEVDKGWIKSTEYDTQTNADGWSFQVSMNATVKFISTGQSVSLSTLDAAYLTNTGIHFLRYRNGMTSIAANSLLTENFGIENLAKWDMNRITNPVQIISLPNGDNESTDLGTAVFVEINTISNDVGGTIFFTHIRHNGYPYYSVEIYSDDTAYRTFDVSVTETPVLRVYYILYGNDNKTAGNDLAIFGTLVVKFDFLRKPSVLKSDTTEYETVITSNEIRNWFPISFSFSDTKYSVESFISNAGIYEYSEEFDTFTQKLLFSAPKVVSEIYPLLLQDDDAGTYYYIGKVSNNKLVVYKKGFKNLLTIDASVRGEWKFNGTVSSVAQLDRLYVSVENTVYISYPASDDAGNLLLYFKESDSNVYDYPITNLYPISTTEMGVFFENELWYIVYDNDLQQYRHIKSKIQLGCPEGNEIITSFDGTRIIFSTKRGLVAMTYQDYIASTEQALVFLSDAILSKYKEFSYKKPVKLCQYDYWIICYTGGNSVLVYDYRNSSWWPMSTDAIASLKQILSFEDRLTVVTDDKLCGLSTSIYDYYDVGNIPIDWRIASQKLHLEAPNNYKHISSITFDTVLTEEPYDYCNFLVDINNYRNVMDKPVQQAVEFEVDSLRAYVKRLNYSKVINFQYILHNDTEAVFQIPLSVSNITIKYGVKGEVR